LAPIPGALRRLVKGGRRGPLRDSSGSIKMMIII
jgi:hypothetical protein